MSVDVRYPRGPLYRDIDGFRLNAYVPVDLYRSALKYKPRSDDVFIVTFPKSGTLWMQQIGYLIFHDGSPAPDGLEFYKTTPFLEMFGAEDVVKMKRPGLIKTHLPYDLIPKSPSAKYVYVCRNPKDVCVSFFYHTKGFVAYDFADGSFEDYFDVFTQGANDFGDYFDHVLSWYAHRNDPNVLFLRYEDIKADPRSQVLKFAAFLGEEYRKKTRTTGGTGPSHRVQWNRFYEIQDWCRHKGVPHQATRKRRGRVSGSEAVSLLGQKISQNSRVYPERASRRLEGTLYAGDERNNGGQDLSKTRGHGSH